jgi:uncharacterized protein YkwD
VRRLPHNRLWDLAVLMVALVAAAAARSDALSAVQVLREGGCGGVLPAALPLRPNGLLDRTAADWAAGGPLSAAAERAGYPAGSTAGLHVSGPDASMLQLIRKSGCRTVMNRGLHEIGIYHRGLDTWLVMASFYPMPAGSRAPGAMSTRVTGVRAPTTSPSLSTAPAAQAASAPSAAPIATPALATRALQLVNRVRARGTRCGARPFAPAPPVTLSGTLAGVAYGHANDMAEHDYFEHQDLTGQSPADRVRAVGYHEKLVGENIAYGPGSVEEVVQGWLNSPDHCENIMDPRFAEMGIAFAAGRTSSRRGLYWVQVLAEPRA